MIWSQVLGHEQQVEMFRRAVQRGRLAHAYLLVGPAGIGKRLFARTLAQCLLCERVSEKELDACGECSSCRQIQAGTHPDLISVGLPEGKKIFPIGLIVGEEGQRGRSGLCYEIAMSPMRGSRRIALIDDAQAMNEEAANSLLKTLEEPPPGSVLLLLTPDTEPILPTIRSRCQPVRFQPLADETLGLLLRQQGFSEEEIRETVSLADGSLETARQLLDPGIRQLWQTVRKALGSGSVLPRPAIQQVSAALEEIGGDTAAQRQNMQWVVQFAVETLRRRLREAQTAEEQDRIGLLLERCFDADLHLRQTMPVPLCLEALFTELGQRSRSPV